MYHLSSQDTRNKVYKTCFKLTVIALGAWSLTQNKGKSLESLLAMYEPASSLKEALLQEGMFPFCMRAHAHPNTFLNTNAPSKDYGSHASPWSEIAIAKLQESMSNISYFSVLKNVKGQTYSQHLILDHICAADPKTTIQRGTLDQLRQQGFKGKDAYETYINQGENEVIESFFCYGEKWHKLPCSLTRLAQTLV